MKKILFKGKCVITNRWVEGSLLIDEHNNHYIGVLLPFEGTKYYMVNSRANRKSLTRFMGVGLVMVDPITVSQFTGLFDKNKNKIFENDIVDCWSEGVNAQGTVKQRQDGLWIIYPAWQKHIMWGLYPDKYNNTTVEIIGNIYDNPKLLKERN